jgi:hypothetical protein
LDPLPTIIACATLAFILFATFAPPSLPTIGWAVTLLGVFWWLGLRFVQWKGRWELVVRRIPYIEIDYNGEPIQKAEFVEHEHIPVLG